MRFKLWSRTFISYFLFLESFLLFPPHFFFHPFKTRFTCRLFVIPYDFLLWILISSQKFFLFCNVVENLLFTFLFLKFWSNRLSWIKAIAWCYHSKYSLIFMVNDSWTSQQGLLGEFHYLIKSVFLSSLDQFLKVA